MKKSLKFSWQIIVDVDSSDDVEKWIGLFLLFHYLDRDRVEVVVTDEPDNKGRTLGGMRGLPPLRENIGEPIQMQVERSCFQMDSTKGGEEMNMKFCANCNKYFHEKDIKIWKEELYDEVIEIKFCPNCGRIFGDIRNLTYGNEISRKSSNVRSSLCADYGKFPTKEDMICKACSVLEMCEDELNKKKNGCSKKGCPHYPCGTAWTDCRDYEEEK